MTFEPIRDNRGQPRVKCTCGDCGKTEVVAAVHGRSGHDGEGQAVKKLQNMGWTYIGKHLRCGTCEAKRKVVNMKDRQSKLATLAPDAPAREPTRLEKRQIMDLLEDVYDIEMERYRRGDTDDSVAEVLDVMPGWVADIREEFFGPSGDNQDMAALDARLTELEAPLEKAYIECQRSLAETSHLRTALRDVRAQLDAIKATVGPRILRKAGVR